MDDRDDLQDVPVWPAFVDLLAATTLLLLVFIAVSAGVGDPGGRGVATRWGELRRTLSKRSQMGHFAVDTIAPDSLMVRVILSEQATFARGRFAWRDLRATGKQGLREIGEALRAPGVDSLYARVDVVGHADHDPYVARADDTASSWSNWELSASRAAVVARFLVDSVGLDPCRVSAAGRGPYHPLIMPRDGLLSDSEKEQNRRIEIEIRPLQRSLDRGQSSGACYRPGDRGGPRG